MNNNISYSLLESNRFGRSVFRGSLEKIDIGLLNEFYRNNDPDTVILRFPATEQPNVYQLLTLVKEVIFADTLVYYKVSLEDLPQKTLKNDLIFRIAGPEDKNQLNEIIPLIFKDYTNHYFSNPKFDKGRIIEGYVEWAANYLGAEKKVVFLVYKDGQLAAFATVSTEVAEGILYGVMPNFSGGGIYADLIRYTQAYLKQEGHKSMIVSTQIQNYSVQKVWIREGFNISHAFITIHLNK